MALTTEELRYLLTLDPRKFTGALKSVRAQVDQTRKTTETPFKFSEKGTGQILNNIKNIAVAWLSFRAVVGSVDIFREFETGIANIATLGVENIGELEESILRIGSTTPIALNDLTSGLYQVVSAGVDASNQLQVLETSAKAAKAGLAETSDALGLAAAVVKAYGLEWDQTETILDKAFQTVKLGQTTFGELSKEMGKVAPLAATLKVSTEELFGAFATLTGVTGDTSLVATQLRSILAALAKPTEEMQAAIERAGYASAELLVQQEGLVGVLKFLQKESGGSAQEMAKLFGRIEAVNAALALSGTQFDTFVEKSGAMEDSAGSLNKAFEIQAETLDSSIQLLKNNFDVLVIAALNGLVPALNVVFGSIAGIIKAFNNLSPAAKTLAVSIGFLTLAVLKGRQAVLAMQLAIRLLYSSMGPVGWLILGIGLAAEALVFMSGSADDASESMEDLNKQFDRNRVRGYKEEISDFTKVLSGLQDEFDKRQYEYLNTRLFELGGTLKVLDKNTEEYADTLRKYNQVEKEWQALRQKAGVFEETLPTGDFSKLTAKQIEALDKLRAYQFESNRITLAEYVDYLESRQDAVRVELGKETAEYLKFADNLDRLRQQLQEQKTEVPIKLDFRTDTPQLNLENLFEFDSEDQTAAARGFFAELFNLQLLFNEQSFEALESEFQTRKGYADLNVEIARQAYGEESEEYKKAVLQRLALENNFQSEKTRLAIAGARATAQAGDALIGAFQGQSKVLFDIGKALAIANATITQFEAAARAFKDYPFPFNIGIAATQLALVAGYIGRIQAVNFTPTGFKEGSREPLKMADIVQTVFVNRKFAEGSSRPLSPVDVIQSVFTPPGESGLVAVQTGEFIMNRKATREFSDVLRAMNAGQFQRPIIQRFQEGGIVGKPSPTPASAPNVVTMQDLQEIVRAIEGIRINIRAELDAMRFFKENFSKFEDNRNERRIT